MIRVGRRIYNKNGSFTDPSYEGFTPILCLTASSPYGSLGPYVLKNDKNQIMENIWQFSKVYKSVPKTTCTYSRYDKRVIWSHPAEVHIDENDSPNEKYWEWREKGMNAKDPIRYPVGFDNRHNCLYALYEDSEGNMEGPLDYIESRKKIYLPLYCELVKKQPKYNKLKERLENGENLLIIEVDGPHEESMDYYREKYGVPDDFIEGSTILVTPENMDILLNDPKHPFGHGYCLGLALL